MRRLSASLALVFVLVASVVVRADSTPAINGSVSGIELCPQFICGAAIFTGIFTGQVGVNPSAIGIMTVAMQHEDLPDPGESAAITGGVWRLRLLSGRTIAGIVTPGVEGELFANNDNTFNVDVPLTIVSGGFGTLSFVGVLDHNTPIPRIAGDLQ